MTHERPPVQVERLLATLLGDEPATRYVVGDLREEYAARAGGQAGVRVKLWYAMQVIRIGLRVRIERSLTRDDELRRPPRAGDVMSTEIRHAIRFLGRRPAFSGAIVLTVALAIAATTLAFAVVNGVLLRPLPYATPDRLVAVWEHRFDREQDHNVVSPSNFLTWREELRSLEALSIIVEFSNTLLEDGRAERVGVVLTSAAYYDIVGARPLLGRFYTEADDVDGAEATAVLSEGYWRRRFGADSSVIGRTVQLGGTARTIVGVLPEQYDFDVAASFGGIGSRDIWIPAQLGAGAREARGRVYQVIGRLASGVTSADAQREATVLAGELEERFPERQTGWGINVVPLHEDTVGDVRSTLLIVFGAVCFVLLIACANIANLLMTRATERQQEIAVRAALGAGRGRLVRQLLMESLVLSAVGAAVGVAVAWWGVHALVATAPDIPRIDGVGMDATVIAFALLATLIAAMLFGMLPALHVSGGAVADWLRDRGGAGRRGARRVRGALVVAQMGLSLVLLIGAGLMIRSLLNRFDLGVGFDTDRLLTAEVQLPSDPYDSPERQALLFEELVERVAARPGVIAASAIVFPPLTGLGTGTSIWPTDRPDPAPGQSPGADIRWIHRDYVNVMGIPVLEGRNFGMADRAGAPLVVLVNETGARQFWPGEQAIGKQVAMPWGDTLRAEVVGVVGDVRHTGPDGEQGPMFYWEHRQFRPFSQMSLVVRTTSEPTTIVPAIRSTLSDLDPNLPLFNVRSMDELFAASVARPRFTTISLALFALLALILAAIGTYAVIAYATEQRSREIGIRIALGADRGAVQRMVVGQGALLIAAALLLGSAGALALSRLLKGLMFDVATTDPLTFAAMASLLVVIGILACWLPARRASRIDPVSAIRRE